MKRLSIIAIAATVLFANCTKDISNTLNVDPKSPSAATSAGLFTDGELALANTYTTTSISVAPFRVISQEWAENTYVFEANYNFADYNSPGGFWQALYVNAIHNLDLAKQQFPATWSGSEAGLRSSMDITDLLEIYGYYMLMGTYGNIPYSQAENVNIPFPVFDDAATVYADLLLRVDSCIAGLSANDGTAMGAADQIYGGDPVAWLKFAASLKLKMAMLNAAHDPTTAAKKVNEAIGTGVFTSNSDNALFAYDAASPTNSSPLWQALFYSGRNDFGPSALLVNTMVGWNDPRLPDYFMLDGNGNYTGGNAGDPSNSYGGYSDFCCSSPKLTNIYSPTLQGDLLDYAQVEFYKAEAAAQGLITSGPANAEPYYDSAITASITFWGGAAGDAATYLAQPSVAYTSALATDGSWQQVIGYQEWIANYNHNWDSWTDIRRLGQPNINIVSPPIDANGQLFPLRYYYPPNETTSNPKNTAAAVAALPGGLDVTTAKLFWEP
jgi:hypothetical protein